MTNTAKSVLIAVDGSDSDRSVVGQAVALFGHNAHYVVVSVTAEPLNLGAVSMSYATASAFSAPALSSFADGLTADSAEAVASRAAGEAGLTDVDMVGEVGDPATVLLEQAAEHDVDVIVVGVSERGWLSRLFDPSVEAAVVHRAVRPVLVVHPRN